MRQDPEKRAERRAQGERLKQARVRLGLTTVEAAAKHLHVPIDTYRQHENGTNGISRLVREYADQLGVSEAWLLSGRDPPAWAVPELELTSEEMAGGAAHMLRAWREHARMQPSQLADKLEIPSDLITRWESGELELSDRWLRKLADVFDTTPGSILDVDPSRVTPATLALWREVVATQRTPTAPSKDRRSEAA